MTDVIRPLVDDRNADAAKAEAERRYAEKRPISAAHAQAAAKVLPGGSTRSVLHIDPFPFRVESAHGATLVDVDGHRYVDFLGDYTAGLLGHNPPEVAEALTEAIGRGWSMGAVGEADHRLAELLCARYPSIDLIRFTNSGTEANLMAVSLARHHTGKRLVLGFQGGYHGGVLYFGDAGVPLRAPYDYTLCPYNDLGAVSDALDRHGADTACVLVEPMMGSGGCIPARPGFLQGLRQLCDDHGVLLIFDEVMTSRMSLGGVQAMVGVTPDLTTLGKYLGGGMTFGAFGGSEEILAAFDQDRGGPLTHPGTFNNNVMTMAAGVAASEQILTSEALDGLFAAGEALRMEVDRVLEPVGMGATGMGSLMGIHPARGTVLAPSDLGDTDHRLLPLLFHGMLERGFYLAVRGFVALSLVVSDEDRSGFTSALVEVVDELVAAGVFATAE
ncbi:MAG: aminotransferase class III-fold pyridoxal phosphate-dependent enzyme [Actinomycetota bacterium]